MVKIHIDEIISALQQSDFLWIIIPIFFIGVVTDKYQEEFGTSIGNAISNGALIIFTGFSWLQLISSRMDLPTSLLTSQYIFSFLLIAYGFMIIASGFKTGEFAKIYGRIRVITFMLMFFTMMIYVPILYNFVSIIIFVLVFPFYYAFITELIKIMPKVGTSSNNLIKILDSNIKNNKLILNTNSDSFLKNLKYKMHEYLK